MRIPSYLQHRESNNDQAMTPMIDVVFLLLIFFVCASIGQIREAILPTEIAAGSLQSEKVIERENPLGEVWLKLRHEDGRTIAEVNGRDYADFAALEETLTSLAELAPEIPIILDVGQQVPLGELIRTYDTCRAARFESINCARDAATLRKEP